jgi:hypothetical protein
MFGHALVLNVTIEWNVWSLYGHGCSSSIFGVPQAALALSNLDSVQQQI